MGSYRIRILRASPDPDLEEQPLASADLEFDGLDDEIGTGSIHKVASTMLTDSVVIELQRTA